MNMRKALLEDLEEIRNLVMSLTHFYLDDSSARLPDWFSETLTESAFAQRLTSSEFQNYVVEQDGLIVGYLSIKQGDYLYHLFVAEAFQGNGIARRLWLHARSQTSAKVFRLRSSIYAVPVYKRLGFEESGPLGTIEGISFQPMELRLDH
ncbi:acetyltransferase [Gynuella sunshinyii YC6258]|uniref:Acetyltransferase n=2 Tax=Gynuella sunshinyii TaxID=1445505 RepID=A0A0C5VS52_9GAMM|nr:acetyltransferase [Gynuella sunshinyii YC6258]